MSRAADCAKSLASFCEDNYNSSGNVVTINGKNFSNVISRNNLIDAFGYKRINTS